MTCKEAESLVTRYIRGGLDDGTLEEFLDHIDACEDCREELEIYFTVAVGLRQLDSGTGNYNIKGALEQELEQSRQHLSAVRAVKAARYAVTTLSVLGLILTFLLQCRIWWQQGIF